MEAGSGVGFVLPRGDGVSVWLVIPSARPVAEVNACMDKWRDMGYDIALWRDQVHYTGDLENPRADLLFGGSPYPGYAAAVNEMARGILSGNRFFPGDPACDWIVCAGDDTAPNPTKSAELIGWECSEHFGGIWTDRDQRTFGVMQPTGDPWSDHQGRIIERIAGSPWLGREWCRRAYSGRGPLWPEYTHCFADEELQLVAQKFGVFWQRPDLTHMHNNWARERGMAEDMPAFLAEANSPQHWAKYSALFNQRKAAGFPGSELIA